MKLTTIATILRGNQCSCRATRGIECPRMTRIGTETLNISVDLCNLWEYMSHGRAFFSLKINFRSKHLCCTTFIRTIMSELT